VTPIRAVCIFAPQTSSSGVFIDHAVHTTWRDAKEESRTPKLLEVAKVAMPIWLWHDANTQAFSFKQTSYYSSSECRMVHVGISAEEYHVSTIPTTQIHFFACCGKPIGLYDCSFFQSM
jgi:hypothetical protein